ncbi:MAG: helix-turn-helix domain-containing protein [Planctomycetaceae bacterium]|nr:helix-turn-helix domain-containing protein [Planctomycetaceae bacterium]
MPRPLPLPIREMMFRLWQQGHQAPQIAAALGLSRATAYRLLQRFRREGSEGIPPGYRHPAADAPPPDGVRAALELRRAHPTWGAALIRVQLLEDDPQRSVPSERTLQRWFARADLTPAPAGRRPRARTLRATAPHETWQMDAKDHIKLKSNEEVSWIRMIDECSSGVLHTTIFPPRGVGPSPSRGRAGSAPPGLRPVGPARLPAGRQRRALGLDRRLPHRIGALGHRAGGRHALEPSEAAPGEWGRRAIAGDLRPVVRAVDVRFARGVARATGADGPDVPRGLPLSEAAQPLGRVPGPGALGAALRSGAGGGALGVVARGRPLGDLRGGPAGGLEGAGLAV